MSTHFQQKSIVSSGISARCKSCLSLFIKMTTACSLMFITQPHNEHHMADRCRSIYSPTQAQFFEHNVDKAGNTPKYSYQDLLVISVLVGLLSSTCLRTECSSLYIPSYSYTSKLFPRILSKSRGSLINRLKKPKGKLPFLHLIWSSKLIADLCLAINQKLKTNLQKIDFKTRTN